MSGVGGLDAQTAEYVKPYPGGGYFCAPCGKVLRIDRFALARRHFKDLHWAEAPSYRCPACEKAYSSLSALRMHIRRRHPHLKGVPLENFAVQRESPA